MNILIKLGCSKIFFGEEALRGIESMKGSKKRAFIVMNGPILNEVGLLTILTNKLDEQDFEWSVYDGVETEPSFKSIENGLKQMKDFNPDWIIGFGGGSAMDAAKALWVFFENEECKTLTDVTAPNIIKYLGEKAKVCCIPTSAGTGSEMTRAAVIKDAKEKKKYSIVDMNGRLVPEVAILDPQFTKTMPKSLITASGMDALTHAIESYVANNTTPFSKAMSLGSFLSVVRNIREVYETNHVNERLNMLAASAMGGIAFSNSGLGIVHSIAHSFGAEFGIPHGLANAVILPYGIQYNSRNRNVEKLYQELAYYAKVESLQKFIELLKEELGIPVSLNKLLPEDKFKERKLTIVTKALNDMCTKFNPVPINQEEMGNLIQKAYFGK